MSEGCGSDKKSGRDAHVEDECRSARWLRMIGANCQLLPILVVMKMCVMLLKCALFVLFWSAWDD